MRSWLGQIDYSEGSMQYQKVQETDRKNVSFFNDPSKVKKLSEYIEEAKQTLINVVENYKNIYGKSELD